MVQSINSKVDLVMAGTSYMGLTDYGKIMIGNKGFEFFNERDVNKYIQIPWDEVDKVIASVMFRGRFIPRFAIQTKKDAKVCCAPEHGPLVDLFPSFTAQFEPLI